MRQTNSDIQGRKLETERDLTLDERGYFGAAQTFLTYSYRENLFAQLDRLVEAGKTVDGLIIDLMQTGFSLPLDALAKFAQYAKRLLKPSGVLLFVKADGAITLSKDDTSGALTLNVYDSPFGIFARHPLLADYVCATVSGIDRRRLRGGGSTLATHILYNSVPVVREEGREVKNDFTLPAPQNWVLQLIDDYSSVESVVRTLEARNQLPADETLRILQEMESQRFIYPIFARVQFLSNCYHNRKRFRLGRYMVAAGILTESELQDLLEQQQEEGWGKQQKTYLGLLAVRQGFISTRELEVLLDDQYLYGGYNADRMKDPASKERAMNTDSMRDSMIGSLGAIDTAGLLQSLSTAKKTGLLSVENRDKSCTVAFSMGKPTHAKMNHLTGIDAMTEFLVDWSEGIFVFKDKATSPELDDTCALSQSLDKMLLDSALYQDQLNQILGNLPSGKNTILERVWNFETLWSKTLEKKLKYMDESTPSDEDKQNIISLVQLIDGLSTIDEVTRSFDIWPGYMIMKAIQLLIDNKLVSIQQASLFRPLTVFQKITGEIQEVIGKEDNRAILEASLHYVHGDSPASNRFNIDHEGRVSVNLSQVKRAGAPVSAVLLELRRWMEAYLAYCRRQSDPAVIDEIVTRIIDSHRS
ncbi:MAG: DUF4388 domain-containing protein [Candidatus Obscuribacterales bacterium]|nr:DUF4388 domain-containing protein [Candidatus Obscuribacterales bacterium]